MTYDLICGKNPDALYELLSVSPIDMDVGADLILGWNWISSHNLQHLYADGHVFAFGQGPLGCSWTSSLWAPARRRVHCRWSATRSFASCFGS